MLKTTVEQDVTRIFNPLTSPNPTIALNTVTLVGGCSETTLHIDDHQFLKAAFEHLNDTGVPLSPQFSLQSINLSSQNRDFLKEQPKTDFLVVCFIHNPPKKDAQLYIDEPHHICGISPLHHEPGLWEKSALQSGAKAIYVQGGDSELNAEHFVSDNFALIASQTLYSFTKGLLLRRDYAQTLINSGALSKKQTANLKQKLQAG